MAQPSPTQPQPPQPPLHWKRDAESPPIHGVYNLDPNIVNAPISDILQAVADAWGRKRDYWVKQLSSCMVKHGVVPEDANQYATTLVSALERVNGKDPKVFPPFSEVKTLVNALILNLPLAAREVLLTYEAKYSWYSNYAYNFMQVRFQLIEVKVGCEEPSSFDWTFTNLQMVYSPIPLPNVVHPVELKKNFMRLVWDKSTHFWKDMKYSSETNYMKSATNVLLHKMFEKTGINLTGQTAKQIRERVLRNVKYVEGLKNFDAIDTVLDQLISFLSQTYVSL